MKIRIKFTNTKKFIVIVDDESEKIFKVLKENISRLFEINYKEQLFEFDLSFNGKDIIEGEDLSSLSSLGIVDGDLLTLLKKSDTQIKNKDNKMSNVEVSPAASSSMLDANDKNPPKHIVEAFERYRPANGDQALNLLIHLAVCERGFISKETGSTTAPQDTWKNVATLEYSLPGFHNFICTIVIVPQGNTKSVMASFKNQSSSIRVDIETKNYIDLSTDQVVSPNDLKNLCQLTKIVRNELLYPLQVAAYHNHLGIPAPWHLEGLPKEVLVHLLDCLDRKSIMVLSHTCKRLNEVCKDNKVWYKLFKRDFKKESHSSDKVFGADWRMKYKDMYQRKVEEEKERKPQSVPPFPERNPINPFPVHPPIPGRYPINPFPVRGDDPFPPGIYPEQPNPFFDPDSQYFTGEIPPPGPRFPQGPNFGFPPQGRRNPRGGGPRFDFF